MRLGYVALAALALATLWQPQRAAADDYPSRTITIVIPLGAGGAMDNIGRVIADRLSKRLHVPVIIENKPGGGMVIGADAVARARPDGYTLMLAPSGAYVINPTLYKKLPYDPEKDFVPLSHYADIPFVLVVNPKLPVHSVKELIAYAKDNPNKLSYAASTIGAVIHLSGEILKHEAGISMVSVPYSKGGPAALYDVVAGNVQVTFADPSLAPSLIKAGKIRALGVSSSTRMKTLPDVPTVAEAGIPGFVATSWHMIVAPAKTPKPIVDKLHAAFQAVAAEPDVHAQMLRIGLIPVKPSSLAELRRFVASENVRWSKVVEQAGVAHSK